MQGQQAIPIQYTYDFQAAVGGKITAIAISSLDSTTFYVGTENGYLLNSVNDGVSWTSELLSLFMYVRAIYPSKVTYSKLWVGGHHDRYSRYLNIRLDFAIEDSAAMCHDSTITLGPNHRRDYHTYFLAC